MTEDELQQRFIETIAKKAKPFQPFAQNFAKQRFLLYSTEFATNAEETEALQKIADGIRCRVEKSGEGVSVEIDFDAGDRGNYLEVVEEGMDAPLTGGHSGIVTTPDGSTRPSNVPEQLWGTPIDVYAKSGSEVLDEVKVMLKDLFTNRMKELVTESKPELAMLAKDYIRQEIRHAFK